MSADVEQRLKEIEERVNGGVYDHSVLRTNDRAFLLALVRKYREALLGMYSDSAKYPQLKIHEHHQQRMDDALEFNPERPSHE